MRVNVNSLLRLKNTLPPEYYEQVVSQYKKNLHKNSSSAAYRKRSAENAVCEALLAGQEIPRFTGPVRVLIHTVRKALPRDLGAISYKAVLDSIVSCGILEDDNRKIVQEIIPTDSAGPEEYTDIIIENI